MYFLYAILAVSVAILYKWCLHLADEHFGTSKSTWWNALGAVWCVGVGVTLLLSGDPPAQAGGIVSFFCAWELATNVWRRPIINYGPFSPSFWLSPMWGRPEDRNSAGSRGRRQRRASRRKKGR
jgi:hypothetical protein